MLSGKLSIALRLLHSHKCVFTGRRLNLSCVGLSTGQRQRFEHAQAVNKSHPHSQQHVFGLRLSSVEARGLCEVDILVHSFRHFSPRRFEQHGFRLRLSSLEAKGLCPMDSVCCVCVCVCVSMLHRVRACCICIYIHIYTCLNICIYII